MQVLRRHVQHVAGRCTCTAVAATSSTFTVQPVQYGTAAVHNLI
jgi:hypothetical protein